MLASEQMLRLTHHLRNTDYSLNSFEYVFTCIGKRLRFMQIYVELRIQHSFRCPPLEGSYVLNEYHWR